MTSSWPTKRGKKSARPNLISAAATTFKSWAPPAIEIMVHKNEEIICLYIDAWIGKQKLNKTLVDFSIVVKLICRRMVDDLNL